MSAQDQPEGIAIVGMAGRFPKAASVDELWRNLLAGLDGITTLSAAELDAAGVPEAVRRDPSFVPRQGLLAGFDRFDAGFFGYGAAEAASLDPQHRAFLEVCWEALEHAGLDPARAKGPIGVYGGCGVPTYLLHNVLRNVAAVSDDPAGDFATIIGNDKDFLATRVAYKLDLTGPAVTVQSACSTSLVAVHMACQALLAFECDVALAGGSTITMPQGAGYRHQAGMILSSDGRCRSFDAEASGAVFGSGCAVVVLKRLADALADGDLIEAVILGTAVNNDGAAKAGYTAPGVAGQARVIALAQAVAGVDPATIGYIEAHGTATPLGDPIEIAALTEAFRRSTDATGYCRIGSVKSAVGHLDTAAGVTGLISATLAVRHGEIPPSQHVTRPNPALGLDRTPFIVADRRQPWPDLAGPRHAGVSAFGIGGTNAHVVLGEAPARATSVNDWTGPGLLLLSARSPDALAGLAERYAAHLEQTDASLADICGSAFNRRALHRWRVAVAGHSTAGLAETLAALAPSIGAMALDAGRLDGARRTVFVFPGQGSQWVGMGRDLIDHEPVFRAAIADCARAFAPFIDWDLVATLRGEGPQAALDRIDVVQPALFAMQVALAALWRSRGVVPEAVVGHSMGEAAAATVAGALSLEDAARVICRRSSLLRTVSDRGAMLAVDRPAASLDALLADLGIADRVAVAVSNAPASSVLSGDRALLETLAARLDGEGAATGWVKVDVASHGPQMDPLEAPLREALSDLRPRAATVPFLSTVTGDWIDGSELDAGYWWRNLRGRVRFHEAVAALSGAGYGVFVEASPHPVLVEPVRATLADLGRPGLGTATLRRDTDPVLAFAEAAGRLFCAGQTVSLAPWQPPRWSFVRLPAYAWDRQRYWIEPPVRREAIAAAAQTATPAIGRPETTEQRLAAIWRDVLGAPPPSREASFFLSGGHSLMALRLLKQVQAAFGSAPTIAQFLQAPTLDGLAGLVDQTAARPPQALPPHILAVQPNGSRPPLFMAPPIMGTAFPYFTLAVELGPDQPFYALVPPGLQDGGPTSPDMEGQAAAFARSIEAVAPTGPIRVGGWSFGAPLAFEVARELDRRGREVTATLLIDTPAQIASQKPGLVEAFRFLFGTVLGNIMPYLRAYLSLRGRAGAEGVWAMLRAYAANVRASVAYRPAPWRGSVTLLRTQTSGTGADRAQDWGWSMLAEGGVRVVRIPGSHMTLLQPPHVAIVAELITAELAGNVPPTGKELP